MSSSALRQEASDDIAQKSALPARRRTSQEVQESPQTNQHPFVDQRPQAIAQRRFRDIASHSARSQQFRALQDVVRGDSQTLQRKTTSSVATASTAPLLEEDEALRGETKVLPVQRAAVAATPKVNDTGLPDNLKTGIESLSGMSLDHVRVHYNSSRPAQLNALAYAQGDQIHLSPGHERHVPHEAWHVVQQAQGRVKPTMQMKEGVAINDDSGLEREADVMAEKALRQDTTQMKSHAHRSGMSPGHDVVQRVVYPNDNAMWAAVAPGFPYVSIMAVVNGNAELSALYQAIAGHMNMMNFVLSPGTEPQAAYQQNATGTYDIEYDSPTNYHNRYQHEEYFVGAMIHEMGHVASSQLYQTQIPDGSTYHIANMHLPANTGATFAGTNVGVNQVAGPGGATAQEADMDANWITLDALLAQSHDFSTDEKQFLHGRINYARGATPHAHYDTVLLDILYYLQHQHMTQTHVYLQATAMLHEANTRRAAGNGVVQQVQAVGAPAQDTATLHHDVGQMLNDARWGSKGKAFIGHKTPDGIAHLRTLFQNNAPNRRDNLMTIQAAAHAMVNTVSSRRLPITQQAYTALSADYRTVGLVPAIASINAVVALL
jgi:hypothetical protein